MNSVNRRLLKPKIPHTKEAHGFQKQNNLPRTISTKRKNCDCEDPQPSKRIHLNQEPDVDVPNSNTLQKPPIKRQNFNKKNVIPKSSTISKYSANDRLKNYRKSLEERKDEIVKVHQIFTTSTPNCSHTLKSTELDLSISNSGTPSSVQNRLLRPKRSKYRLPKRSVLKSTNVNMLDSPQVTNSRMSSLSQTSNEIEIWNPLQHSKTESVTVCDMPHVTKNLDSPNSYVVSNSDFSDRNLLETTNNSIVCNAETHRNIVDDEDCEMEWNSIDVGEVVSDIQKLRKNKTFFSLNYNERNSKDDCNVINRNENNIYVVVDTNVFISHLNTVKELISLSAQENAFPVVCVPWMVIQELDYLKDGRSESNNIKNSARKAVKFINENLTSRNCRLKGQTVLDALKQEAMSSNPDDGILFCCIQLNQQSKITLLLSNDTNLRNKALIHDICAYGSNNIISEIQHKFFNNIKDKSKSKQVMSIFTDLCSFIIENEIRLAYGSTMYNLISKPPWDMKQCLIYFKRFWISVFSLVISQKQFTKVVDDLLYFISTHTEISSEADFEELTKFCLSLCVYFKNCLTKYRDYVQKCITNIQELLS